MNINNRAADINFILGLSYTQFPIVKMGYNANILLFAVLVLWCDGAMAVAPGDQQSHCTTTQGSDPLGLVLVNAYTSRQTPLMDMYWYRLAFGNSGNGVWESIKGNNGLNADGVSVYVFSSVQTASLLVSACITSN